MKTNEYYKKICMVYADLMIITGVVLGIYNIFQSTPYFAAIAFAFALFPAAPFFLNKLLSLRPVYVIHFILYLFITLSYFIGMVLYGYHMWPGLDKVSHTLSGMVFTLLGLCIFYALKKEKTILPSDGPLAVSYSFCFSMMTACIWEILEYGINFAAHNDPQQVIPTGINDTMIDIITCLVGSVFVLIFILFYYKKGKRSIFSDVLEMFHHENVEN